MEKKRGLLVVNLGTPDSPAVSDVRRYLKEFLNDPLVIDINPVLRWMLLNFIIAPIRSKKSAAAYQKIWMKEGSPLLVHSNNFVKKLQARLGQSCTVKLAMRYQNPSIDDAVKEFASENVEDIVFIPMFPQYSLAAWESAAAKVHEVFEAEHPTAQLTGIMPFYNHPDFIKSWVSIGKKHVEGFKPDHILMSFHGIPERHCKKTTQPESGCCERANCCQIRNSHNQDCYRMQCHVTAELIAKDLGLKDGSWTITFQSRLGRTPWIRPYTDEVLLDHAKKGTKKLLVFSPSFVTDCLETVEEIGMRAVEDFKAAGGGELELVPSLNADDTWVDSVHRMYQQNLT